MFPGLELTPPVQPLSGSNATSRLYRGFKVFLTFLMIMRVFGSLIKSPISQFYFYYVGIPLLFLEFLFAIVYLVDKLVVKKATFNPYDIIITFVFVYMMLQGGLAGFAFYGQPVFTGMSEYKPWLLIWDGIIFFYFLKTKFLDLTIVRDGILFGAWFQLPAFMAMILTLNPNQFAGTLFVYCNETKGGCQFEFDIFFFAFAAIYYFIRFVRTNRMHYGLFFVVFFGYIFFVNQKRGTSMALLGTVGLFALLNLKRDKIIIYALGSVLALAVSAVFLYFVRPDILSRVVDMYGNALLALSGEQTGEASADARIRESLIALKFLAKNELSWLFGNSKLDLDWSGIPVEFMHFYASDLGIFGIIFQYGFLGLAVGWLPYFFAIRNHNRSRMFHHNSFYQAITYFLMFFFVRGIPTGGNFFDPGIATAATFVGIHYFFYYSQLYPERNYVSIFKK